MVQETMSMSARYEYIRAMRDVYLRADRREKGEILTHIKTATQLNRKYIITCLNDPDLQQHKRSRERGRKYGADVAQAIGSLADALDWVCAERLQPALTKTAKHMIAHGEVEISAQVLDQLGHISIATTGRILKEIRPRERLPRASSGRPPDTSAQRAVPVSVIAWDVPEPGHFEMDLVHHGVPDQYGWLICTIQFIDVLTGWSERFAIKGTGFDAIYGAIQAFKRHCRIPIREVHSDNGSEFINNALIAALGNEHLNLTQTRGRPGYHNDNRFVEQKNSSLIRAYLGSTPFHTPDELRRLQRLYDDMWVYYNLFQPVLRQTARTAKTGPNGVARIQRRQDTARTPFERLLEAKPPISRETQEYLQARLDSTPLLALKRRIHQQIAELRAPADQPHQDNGNPV